jgi:hypothetical protein
MQETMKETPETDKGTTAKSSRLGSKQTAVLAAVLAVITSCLAISGRGIEGFILWIVVFFMIYWLFFAFLIWLWQVLKRRS